MPTEEPKHRSSSLPRPDRAHVPRKFDRANEPIGDWMAHAVLPDAEPRTDDVSRGGGTIATLYGLIRFWIEVLRWGRRVDE